MLLRGPGGIPLIRGPVIWVIVLRDYLKRCRQVQSVNILHNEYILKIVNRHVLKKVLRLSVTQNFFKSSIYCFVLTFLLVYCGNFCWAVANKTRNGRMQFKIHEENGKEIVNVCFYNLLQLYV